MTPVSTPACKNPGLRRGPDLAEDHAVQQPGITGRDRADLFGGEHDLMPGRTQQLPPHRDLGDIKVPVRKRNQHAHPAIIAARATAAAAANDASIPTTLAPAGRRNRTFNRAPGGGIRQLSGPARMSTASHRSTLLT